MIMLTDSRRVSSFPPAQANLACEAVSCYVNLLQGLGRRENLAVVRETGPVNRSAPTRKNNCETIQWSNHGCNSPLRCRAAARVEHMDLFKFYARSSLSLLILAADMFAQAVTLRGT